MKKIITLSVLSLTVLLATACGTATETDTDSSPDTKTAEVGSCMVSATGSCQDYEDLSGVTSEDLKKDCGIFGTWSDAKCPADYSVGCKTESQQDISGKGTYTLFTMYTKDNSFVDNFKSGCLGEWIEK